MRTAQHIAGGRGVGLSSLFCY